MKQALRNRVRETKEAALRVLRHNARGACRGLPRTAGWGYPEPYTRDLLICGLGILASRDPELTNVFRGVLVELAKNQSALGHIPSLVHDPEDRGASDTTPLFLLMTAIFRGATGDRQFLRGAVEKALRWMDYQSPTDRVIVAQLPTSDWRDELWVLGFGLYVNTLVYAYLVLHGRREKAHTLSGLMGRFAVTADEKHRHVHEGLDARKKPYYALWSYKVSGSERFDLLGNSLAILTGLAGPSRAASLVSWIERESEALRLRGDLECDLPPNLFPYIRPGDPDWRGRYERYNRPGDYHNGGIWPFVCGFYVAALVAAGCRELAERKLDALTRLVRPARQPERPFGFNEWFRATDGTPRGQDWQSWSAAMYLYAAVCVETGTTPFFDEIRRRSHGPPTMPPGP